MTTTCAIRWRSLLPAQGRQRARRVRGRLRRRPEVGAASPWPMAPRKARLPVAGRSCWSRASSPRGKADHVELAAARCGKRWAEEVDHLELAWFAEEKREAGSVRHLPGPVAARSRRADRRALAGRGRRRLLPVPGAAGPAARRLSRSADPAISATARPARLPCGSRQRLARGQADRREVAEPATASC